ncbi:type I toxin-antitoxin system SymE family toxin [Aquabacterium sp. A7-Y]|uniref:SymE family type I addiction module toxin n=1 Tax=Aquabacterium sp. A7-Y TaxID=1349605 RepID=UPI00223D5530|nr:SymE family type I addiction module toxin [Aquabacterium sp. A7-Y]MCW7536267.1 type I toxin-antitoxin system SymE family toxin [Aquabacterium sp. A7-Y]
MAEINHRPGEPSPTRKLEKNERYTTVTGMFRGYERSPSSSPGVYERPTERKVPWIRLGGKWLEEAGFDIQARVRVRVMNGCLVLTTD